MELGPDACDVVDLRFPGVVAADCSVPLNWDDLDPISLEPVCTLSPYFEVIEPASAGAFTLAGNADERGEAEQQTHSRRESRESNSATRVRRYDAWAWLEMMRRDASGQYKHPVTGARLAVNDRAACVKACLKAHRVSAPEIGAAEASNHHAWLLAPCKTPLVVKHIDHRDTVTGRLRGVYFYTVDPSLDVFVTAAWSREHATDSTRPGWASAVHCEAAVRYEIHDADDNKVGERTVWLGSGQ